MSVRRRFPRFAIALALAATVVGLGLRWEADLPDPDALERWAPAQGTLLTDRFGVPIGEFYDERRYVLPAGDIPELVGNAFIAAEDARFRDHFGIDDRDKTWSRKAREAALAVQVERRYDKDTILAFYLNSVFLGSQSYGVEAAARTYFGKGAAELGLGEAAMLAGLPQRPSVYNPFADLALARTRQRYVLDRMVEDGMATAEAADAAAMAELNLADRGNPLARVAPHFAEHVRRLLIAQLGEEAVTRGGLVVRTTCDLSLQHVADAAIRAQIAKVDRASGWRREPDRHLDGPEAIAAWREAQERGRGGTADAPSTLPTGAPLEGVVTEVGTDRMKIGVGAHVVLVRLEDSQWVFPRGDGWSFSAPVDSDGDWQPDVVLFEPGDRLEVRVDPAQTARDRRGRTFPLALLTQDADLEGALLSMELPSGAVRAMVGGADFDDSEFNRATQARRQVGSTFKPFVYAAGLDAGLLTPASMVEDGWLTLPIAEGKTWNPRNYNDDYAGRITITKALAESRNTALVRTLETIDPGMNADLVHRFARRLGLGGAATAGETPEEATPSTDYLCPWVPETRASTVCMDHFPPRSDDGDTDREHRAQLRPDDAHLCRACDYSVGLGSASLTLAEMVRAYSAFAAEGEVIEPRFVEEVHNRRGDLIWAPSDTNRAQVVDPAVAGVMRTMLEAVVERGTATKAAALHLHSAGKTGTTDEGKDAWFIGFTPHVLTGVWIGYDAPRSIGMKATGGRVALPVWMAYMKAAVPEDRPFPPAPGTERVSIDEWTGKRVLDGNWGRPYLFVRGTVPRGVSTEPFVHPPPEAAALTAQGRPPPF